MVKDSREMAHDGHSTEIQVEINMCVHEFPTYMYVHKFPSYTCVHKIPSYTCVCTSLLHTQVRALVPYIYMCVHKGSLAMPARKTKQRPSCYYKTKESVFVPSDSQNRMGAHFHCPIVKSFPGTPRPHGLSPFFPGPTLAVAPIVFLKHKLVRSCPHLHPP